jgi:hypothetical protein
VTSDRRAGAILLTIGATITLVGTFLSWVTSGSTERSSYEVFGLVDRLGFSPNSAIGWALRLWPLVPLSLVITVIAHWVHHPSMRWPRTALTGATLVYPGVTALAVANAPQIALFDVGPGPWVTLAGAVIMLVGLAAPWTLNSIARARSATPSAPVADRS